MTNDSLPEERNDALVEELVAQCLAITGRDRKSSIHKILESHDEVIASAVLLRLKTLQEWGLLETEAGADAPQGTIESEATGLNKCWSDSIANNSLPAKFGDYVLLERVGMGAQGTVYKGKKRADNSIVAIKVLTPWLSNVEAATKRFLREGKMASLVSHDAICRIHETGLVDGTPYIAMNYVDGSSLSKIIAAAQRGRKSVADTPLLIAALAQGLHAVHEAHLVHRDVKPANIVIKSDMSPVLIDFGLARNTDLTTMTATGAILGTPAYMSPEAARGLKSDHRTDIFGLGVVLYECIFLERPFQGATREALQNAIASELPSYSSPLQHRIPKTLRAILDSCLAKDPDDRYADARQLAEDLISFDAGGSVVARSPSLWRRGMRLVRRNPALSLTLGILVAVLLTSLVIVTNLLSDSETNLSTATRNWTKAEAGRRLLLSKSVLSTEPLKALQSALASHTMNPDPDSRSALISALLHHHEWGRYEGRGLAMFCAESDTGGQVLLGGDIAGHIFSWDRASGKTHGVFPGNGSPVDKLLLGTESNSFIAAYRDGSIRQWRTDGGHQPITPKGPRILEWHLDRPTQRLFIRDSQLRIRTCDLKTLLLKDVALNVVDLDRDDSDTIFFLTTDGRVQRLTSINTVDEIAQTRDGKPLSLKIQPTGPRALVRFQTGMPVLIDLVNGRARPFDPQTTGKLVDLRFSSCGEFILSTTSSNSEHVDDNLKLFDMEGKLVWRFRLNNSAKGHPVFSEDGQKLLVSTIDGELLLIDVPTGAKDRSFLGHDQDINFTKFLPEQGQILTASNDGTVRLWQTGNNDAIPTYRGHTGSFALAPIAFTADSNLLCTATSDSTARVWDRTRGTARHILRHDSSTVFPARFVQDDTAVLTGCTDGHVRLFSMETGENTWKVRLPEGAAVFDARMTRDHSRVIASSYTGCLYSINVDKEVPELLIRNTSGRPLHLISLNPDESMAAVGTSVGEILIVNLMRGDLEKRLTAHNGMCLRAEFSPNGKLMASFGQDGKVMLWDTSNWNLLHTFHHTEAVRHLAWHPDSRRLLSASTDRSVRIWDATEGTELIRLDSHVGGATFAAFSPDGQFLASGDRSGVLRLWSDKGEPIFQCRAHEKPIYWLAFNSESTAIATGAWDLTARVWPVNPLPLAQKKIDLFVPTLSKEN